MKTRLLFLSILLLAAAAIFAAEEEDASELVFNEEELIAAVDNLGPTASGFVSVGDFGPQDEDTVDPRVLRDFIESRGLIECRNKEGKLTIAGDVRARWMCTAEKVDTETDKGTLKGSVRGAGTNTAHNIFKSEVNLFLDYVAPRSWVSTKLRWSAFDGIDGGSSTRVDMDRAFIGFDVYNKCTEDFYIEVGRTKLDYLFESRVEFGSTFDGLHIYYTREFPKLGVFVIHGGPFIVDSFSSHYAWAIETGLTKWAGTGLGFKYSIIHWNRHSSTLNYGNLPGAGNVYIEDNARYRFIVSQMLFGYERKIDWCKCKTLYVYAAVLANHVPINADITLNEKNNRAWYAGFTLGKLCKACDWSLDIMYQYVQALAVPEFDLSGIGHGNAANSLLSDLINLGIPNSRRGQGFTNFKGWQFNLLYALTDTLSVRSKLEFSRPIRKSIGGDFKYTNFEMSVIYAF